MSRFEKLSQSIWHCHYHIVWVPKYRYRVLTGAVAAEVNLCIRSFSDRKDCKIVEINVQKGLYKKQFINISGLKHRVKLY